MDKQIVCNTFTAVCPQPKLVIYEISSKNIVSGSLIVYPGDVVLPKIGEQSDFDLVPSGPVSVHLGESASVSAAWSMDVGCLEVSAAIPVPITGTTEYRYEVFQLCNLVPYVIDFTPQNRDGGGTVIFTGAGMVREWTVDLIIDAVPILTGPSAVLYGNSVNILLTLDRDPQGDIEVMVAMSPEVGYTMNSSNWSTGITLPFTPTVGNNVVTARYGSEIATWTVDIEYLSLVLFGDTTVVNGQSASVLVKLSEDPLRTMTIVAHFPDGTTETFTLGTSDWNSGHTVTYTPTEESGGTVTFNPAGYPEGQWDVAILPPTYAVTPNTVSVMETQSVIFTVNTTGVLNGTTLYWTATGTTSAADFVDNMLSGSFTVNSNTAQIVRATVDDLTIEDDETFVLQVRTGSTSGTVVATSTSVLVTDKVTIRTYGLDVAITPTEIMDTYFSTQSMEEANGGYVEFSWKRNYKYGVDEDLTWTPLAIVDEISAGSRVNDITIPSPSFISDNTWAGNMTSGGINVQCYYDGLAVYNAIDVSFRLNGFPKESTAYYQSVEGSQEIYSDVTFGTHAQHRVHTHTFAFAESRGGGAIYAGGTGGQFVGSIGGKSTGVTLLSGQKVNPYPLDKVVSGGRESFDLQPQLTHITGTGASASISYKNENFWKFEPYFEYDSKLDPYLILRELINIHRYVTDYRTYLISIGQNPYQQFVSISSASHQIMIDPNITRTQFEALPTTAYLELEIHASDPNGVGNDMGIQFRDIHQRVVDIFKTRVSSPRSMDNTYVAPSNMTMYGAVSLYGALATASGSLHSKFQWTDYPHDVYSFGEEKREGTFPRVPSVDATRYNSQLGGITSLQSWIVQPMYFLTADVDPVSEGSMITYTVRTYEVPDGTTLYWTTSGNTVAADYFGNIMTGTVVISGGTAQFSRVVIADHLTDPGEAVTTEIRTTSYVGTIRTSLTTSITDTSFDPTYEVIPSTTSINEGATITFTVNTTDVPNGTTLYWTSTGTTNAADFVGSIVSGTISISGNTGSFTRTLVNDVTVEGSENFTIQIRTGSIVGTVVATSSATVVNDTSQSLSYNMIPDVSSVDEGGTVTYSISTTALPDGTTLYWTTTGTANAADFTGGQLTGSVVINSNAGTITRTLVADVTAEGSENFALQLRTGSTAGTIVVNGSSITINDTSIGPTYAITPLNMWRQPTTSFNEGDQIVVQVDTTLVDDGTTLYWTLNGTTDSADFASGITGGPIDIYYGFNMFAIQTVLDSDVEGTETFAIQLRTGSIAGPIVATSSTISLSEVPVEFHLDMLWPGYSISEGDMLVINLIATGLATGTTVYYTIESPTMTAVDFTGGMSGSFTMSAYWMGPGVTAGGIQIYTNVDSGTAAYEQFTVKVRTGSISGPVAMTLGPFVVLNVSP